MFLCVEFDAKMYSFWKLFALSTLGDGISFI